MHFLDHSTKLRESKIRSILAGLSWKRKITLVAAGKLELHGELLRQPQEGKWLKDHARSWGSRVDFQNLTDETACLSIAGPRSRDVLAKLTGESVEERALPFLSAKAMTVAGIPTRALRISYTGELGWELYHPAQHTLALYEALLTAGQESGIGDFGTYALNALRIEKGFRMWGAE
ncbi:Dimethylglycine dehydrogenase, mitochondrial, partial [Araneus ventricosus]